MPFKSEKQRKYLWANEPEIARDWTDTYGSKIHKADGGRIGFFTAGLAAGDEISPGTSSSGGGRDGPPGRSTVARPTITQPKKTIKEKITGGLDNFRQGSIDNFVRRNKYKNLINAGVYPKQPGMIAKILGFMNPDEEVDKFDVDDIKHLYAGGADPKGLAGLRKDFEFEEKYDRPTQSQFEDYYGLNQPLDTGGGGDGGEIPWWLRQQAPVAAVEEETVVADSGLGSGHFRVPEQYRVAEGGRIPAAFGGMMDSYSGRRAYGLGSFISKPFKAAKKAVKKLTSSSIGKLALAAGLGYLATPGTGAGWQKWLKPGGKGNWWKKVMLDSVDSSGRSANVPGLLSKGKKLLSNPWVSIPAAAGAAGLMTAKMPIEELDDVQGRWDEDKAAFDAYLASLDDEDSYRVPEEYVLSAEGGRIGRQEGGLMDLGGMEKDYRNDGGFVPLGGEEKADDVPARLSKNEFVFTADAVKNAGGGDIDKGAEVMENVMKNLEAGGKVSDESQGKGAQEMFEVSERLSEVV